MSMMRISSSQLLAIQVSCGHHDHMRHRVVGARELKVRLGTYLRQVRQGRTLVVTHRGQPVAELRPVAEGATTDAVFTKLEAQGVITRPTTRLGSFRSIARPGLSLSGAVFDNRDDRFDARADGSIRSRPSTGLELSDKPDARSTMRASMASEPRDRSAPAKRRARERVGESEG